MTEERFRDTIHTAEILRFFRQNYSVKEEDVNTVVEEAKRHETQYLKAASYLMFKIGGVAQKTGVVCDRDFPQNHLPTMLVAVKELERDVPSDEKQLTHKHTLEILATAELTTALASAGVLRGYENVQEHAERAVELLKLRKILEGETAFL